eukprot:g6698.t1
MQRSNRRRKQPDSTEFKGALNFEGLLKPPAAKGKQTKGAGGSKGTGKKSARPVLRRAQSASFARSSSFAGRVPAGAAASACAGQPQTVAQRRFVFGEDSSSRSTWASHTAAAGGSAPPDPSPTSALPASSKSQGANWTASKGGGTAAADGGLDNNRVRLFASVLTGASRFASKTKKDSSHKATASAH